MVENHKETDINNRKPNFEVTPVTQEMKEMSYMVYNHIRENNGKVPNWKITPNISWNDMLGHNNTDSERYNELTPEILQNCQAVAVQLQSVYDKYWDGAQINITSGWRSKRNNKNCGGATKSRHLIGQAIDFSLGRHRLQSDYKTIKSVWNGYVLPEATWLHVDIRGFKGYE